MNGIVHRVDEGERHDGRLGVVIKATGEDTGGPSWSPRSSSTPAFPVRSATSTGVCTVYMLEGELTIT